MRLKVLNYVIALMLASTLGSARALACSEVLETRPLIEEIRTLQVVADGDFMKLPVMALGEERGEITDVPAIEVSFDYLADQQPWLVYTLVHCDANWEPDGLGEMDFADGFLPVRIEDVTPSFNTFISYYHYSIRFPNEDVRLTVSGNYAVLIHQEDDLDAVLAVATFSISEQLAFAKGTVSSNTDIDFHKSHQQLSMDFTWSPNKLPYLDVANDIRLVVRQNRRAMTRREVTTPTRLESGRAIYEHCQDLIFDAGNNYRRFEFTDLRYPSIGVDFIEYNPPYYFATLRRDEPRSAGTYFYDKDQNGRYLVHALKVGDEATEAEYFKAVFTLRGNKLPGSPGSNAVYLSGDFTYGQETEEFCMDYDPDADVYYKEVILKQGAYNYLYLVNGSTSIVEGDYFETENEYDIYIYYHPNGARYDRLLGVAKVK